MSQLQAMLEPYADQLVMTSQGGCITGSVSYYLGLLATTIGDWPQAETRFTAAAETHARIGAPIWLARTRMEHARMLLLRASPGTTSGPANCSARRWRPPANSASQTSIGGRSSCSERCE